MAALQIDKLNIFEPSHRGDFNACVGTNSLHDMRTYAEGYLQATQRLLDAIFEKKLINERDTLVHPILYSARHAIELTIKHVLIELNKTDIKTEERLLHGHELNALWTLFKDQTNFDRRFSVISRSIDSIVMQLDQADPDAQDFRYPVNTAGDQTLDGKVIVDLEAVSVMVGFLNKQLIPLFYLVERIVEERNLGSYTKEFNREELEKLSKELPPQKEWKDFAEFARVKTEWIAEYKLTSNGFSRAVDFIRGHREFSANIGIEKDFIALNKSILEEILNSKCEATKADIADSSLSMVERVLKPNPACAAYSAIKNKLNAEMIAELDAIYYLSLQSEISDSYEARYEAHLREFKGLSGEALDKKIKEGFVHIFSKNGLVDVMVRGLTKIGRPSLVKEFEKYIVFQKPDPTDMRLDYFGRFN